MNSGKGTKCIDSYTEMKKSASIRTGDRFACNRELNYKRTNLNLTVSMFEENELTP